MLIIPFFLFAKEYEFTKYAKLQNSSTWNMAYDKKYIYTLTSNYEKETYKIEIYNKKNLKLINTKNLQIPKSFVLKYKKTRVKIYNKPHTIEVNNNHIYIGTSKNIIFYDKNTLKRVNSYTVKRPDIWYDEKEKIYLVRTNDISNFTKYENYIIAYGEGDNIYIFKDDVMVRHINIKKDYPKNITQIKDYFEGSRINHIMIHKDKLYAGNWRGFVNIYDFKNGKFIDQISTIGFNKEYGYVTADDIEYISVYKNRWIYISLDYDGLMILDTKAKKFSNIKTLFEKQKTYSELFKKYFDTTKSTDIYRMVFYKDKLIFSEVNTKQSNLYVYDLQTKKIIKTLNHHKGNISSMFIENNQLFGLNHDGYIYKWNLGKI